MSGDALSGFEPCTSCDVSIAGCLNARDDIWSFSCCSTCLHEFAPPVPAGLEENNDE